MGLPRVWLRLCGLLLPRVVKLGLVTRRRRESSDDYGGRSVLPVEHLLLPRVGLLSHGNK